MQRGVVAVFGGAFDPVHFGHIKPTLQLQRQPEIRQVILLPSRLHPDKGRIGNTSTDDKHRVAMLGLFTNTPGISVDLREIHASETSYTADTLRGFRAELGEDAPFAFVMGEDTFAGICDWRDYRRIPQLAHLIVIRRPDCAEVGSRHPLLEAAGGYAPLGELARQPAGRICRFDNEPVAASSTEVRATLARGEQPRYMIPGAVWSYIRRNRLYGFNDG